MLWMRMTAGSAGLALPAMASLGLALLASGCSGDSNAPLPAPTATQVVPSATMPASTAQRPVVVGGYMPADGAIAEVKAAEKMAVDEIYRREPQRSTVESVVREQQVVAGMNYRFTVKMSGTNSYQVVVYKPLQGDMQVTGFEKLGG